MFTKWTNEHLVGFLPGIFLTTDSRSAADQLNARYAHGGGYSPMNKFKLAYSFDVGQALLEYPGGPTLQEVSRCKLHDEELILFDKLFSCNYPERWRL